MGASQLSYGVDPRPPKLEPDRFAPVFVLAPARSHTSVVTTMVGRHPDLADLLELKLFAYPLKDSLPRFWIERWVTHRSGRFAAFAARPCMTGICAKRTFSKGVVRLLGSEAATLALISAHMDRSLRVEGVRPPPLGDLGPERWDARGTGLVPQTQGPPIVPG